VCSPLCVLKRRARDLRVPQRKPSLKGLSSTFRSETNGDRVSSKRLLKEGEGEPLKREKGEVACVFQRSASPKERKTELDEFGSDLDNERDSRPFSCSSPIPWKKSRRRRNPSNARLCTRLPLVRPLQRRKGGLLERPPLKERRKGGLSCLWGTPSFFKTRCEIQGHSV